MQDYRPLYIKVGIFVFITLLIFVIGIFVISGEQSLFEKEYTNKYLSMEGCLFSV